MKIHNKAILATLYSHLDKLTKMYGNHNVHLIEIRNNVAALYWHGTICYLALKEIEGLQILQMIECLTYISYMTKHEKAKAIFEHEVEENNDD